ncbi:MAG: triose-phosphate isomerase family protein [bacterium]
MKKRYTFIANWKMYFDFNESMNYATKNLDQIISLADLPNASIILCTSFPMLYPLTQIFRQTKVQIGAQNCSDHTKGPFTGQVCAKTLNQIGCTSCIIGHSEIRRYKSETDEMIAKKFDMLIDNGLSPILCIGESESDYKNGKTIEIIDAQLKKVIEIVSQMAKKLNGRPIYIAYEPEWCIGAGKTPPEDKLETIFAWINAQIQKHSPISNWQFLYGGSVNTENAARIGQISYVNGFLIGKMSTNFELFEKIVKSTILGNNS